MTLQSFMDENIVILNPKLSVGETLEELILIAEGSLTNEYQDQIIFLPL